jgi:iron complex outermembrane recepter protein
MRSFAMIAARSALFLIAALPLGAGSLWAQQIPQAAADTIIPVPLQPVEVTVLRTPIREDMAPLAVASMGEDQLRNARTGAFLEEALRGLPGVHVQNRYNFALGEKVVIRGFGGRAQFGIRGVRVIVDGIPATLPDGQGTLDHLDVGSLGRAEVVRGPASALFGNASGGVLAFESRMPAPGAVRLEAEHVQGGNGLVRTQATASGTAHGTGYLINLSTQDFRGFRPNPASEVGDYYGAADRIGLNAQLRRGILGGRMALTFNYLDLDSENPGQLLRTQVEEGVRIAHGLGPVNNIVRQAGKEITQSQAGLRWDGAAGAFDTEVALYGITRRTINPIVPTIIDLDRDATGARFQLSRENSAWWGPMRWHLGVETEFMYDDRLNFVNVNGTRGALTVDQRERVRSAGVFLQGNLALPREANALAGLRFDRLDFRAWDNVQRAPTDLARTGERTMSQISPSLGVNVPVAGAVNVFANVGTVFETPSTTELGNRPDGEGGFNPDLQPQTGASAEIGVRGRMGQRVSYELTTYQTNLRNEIVRYQVAAIPGRDFFRNAGRSRHNGVEATLAAAAPGGLVQGHVTYTYANARFRDFVSDGVDVSGNRIPGIAPQRAEAVLRLTPGPLFAEVAGIHVDAVPVNDRNTPGFSAPAYNLLDVRGGLTTVRVANFSVQPWLAVTNVLDQYYVASVIPNAAPVANPAGARFYDPGPGRTLQIGIRTGWDVLN